MLQKLLRLMCAFLSEWLRTQLPALAILTALLFGIETVPQQPCMTLVISKNPTLLWY